MRRLPLALAVACLLALPATAQARTYTGYSAPAPCAGTDTAEVGIGSTTNHIDAEGDLFCHNYSGIDVESYDLHIRTSGRGDQPWSNTPYGHLVQTSGFLNGPGITLQQVWDWTAAPEYAGCSPQCYLYDVYGTMTIDPSVGPPASITVTSITIGLPYAPGRCPVFDPGCSNEGP